MSLRSSLARLSLISHRAFSRSTLLRQSAAAAPSAASKQPLPPPHIQGELKQYSSKIQGIVTEITKLNLIEVADLNELLRKTLNIKDVPMFSGVPAAQAAPAKKEEPEEPPVQVATKSSFKLKLLKYDDTKKVMLIKEVKALGVNMNLVQAKKFIEAVPQVFRDNIGKDEAEKLKAQLEKCGAVCEIE